ncbi:hypothetical protein GQ457_07G002860 [Hibiscus cannabinus]
MSSDSLSNEQFNNGSNPYYLHQSDSPGMVLVTQPLVNDNYNSWKISMLMALSAKNKLAALPNPVPEATFAIKASVNSRKTRPQCSHFGLLGHTKEKCYKLHGYPPGYISRSKNQVHSNAAMDADSLSTQQCQQLIAMLTSQLQATSTSNVPSSSVNLAMQGKILSFVNSLTSFSIKSCWIIDFGASRHVCYSKDFFESLSPIASGTIMLPNKTVVSVGYAGNVRISERILLKDVLYVPEFRFNLLAVSSLIKDTDLTVLFSKTHCVIQDLCQVIGKGEFYKGLYLLQLPHQSDKLISSRESESVALVSWHDRLGHPSSSVLHLLKDVLPSVENNKNDVCTVCPLAKQKCLPFPVSYTVTASPFELVHCDIWGPYKVPTYDSHRYFLTLVDDYSRSTCTYLLKHKYDVATLIPSFIDMIKRQFGYDMKVFRSDNAPELKFTQLFSDLGIVHQFSCVETPQQNSVVERKHQHLLAVARALFFQARVPIRFWGECILTATYVINRLPSQNLNGKSSYELLYSRLPPYSHLRVFGCLCFVSTLKSTRDKYDSHRYFLTLVDDYSRSTWTYLLKHKYDVATLIPSFIDMIKRQFGYDMKVFRSDNAPELKFTQLFSDLGIVHQFSCVETPQQNSVVERKHQHLLAVARALFFQARNSVVERKHQHLLAVARALFFQARVPIRFWGECILTATYVINRLPSQNLNGKSSYELLYSRLPPYSHLRVFGCLCFVSTLKSTRDKFTKRALPGVFLGYAPGIKGYKIYVLQTHTIVISRNVVFHENIFPFHTVASIDSLIDPFPDTVLPRFVHGHSHIAQDDSIPQRSVATEAIEDDIEEVQDHEFATEEIQNHEFAEEVQNHEVEDTGSDHADVHEAYNGVADVHAEVVVPVIRRSSRISSKPSYLQQYLCNNVSETPSSCLYPIENHISTSQLSPEYADYIFNISLPYEPVFYHQAVKFSEWRDAMQDELQAMDSLKTWSVVQLPVGKKAIDCKWVYRIKRKADGSIDRYKARLVAKGFTQIEGVDYIDTFSPVAKLTSFKLLLALAAVHDWHLLQLDVNNAFLNGMLNEEVYMKLPLGYTTNVSGDNLACKLHKSIYGLKQASRQWFYAFSQVVKQFGFSQSPHEHSLFLKGSGDTLIALLVYVDDIILAGKDLKLLADVQNFLQSHFKLKDLGNLKYFLGFEIARSKSGISLSQRQYALQLLEDTGSLAKKPAELPIASPHKLNKDDGQFLDDPQLYRRMIGRLLYLTHTRPDITYAVNLLSQFVSSPRKTHLQAVHHLLSYIKGSPGLGLFFSSEATLQLTAFVDSDYNSCPDTRRSTTGYCTFLGDTLISWKSKKQHTVSRSSCEAEYRAMAIATCELVWIAALLDSFQISVPQAFLYCDNQSALHLATNQVFHERTKHIEVDCHFVREKVSSGFLRLFHVHSSDQIADIFTKALHYPAFQSFLVKLGLLNIHQSPA